MIIFIYNFSTLKNLIRQPTGKEIASVRTPIPFNLLALLYEGRLKSFAPHFLISQK
jgi:hypothetical protein